MSLIDEIRIAQRNAGEAAVIASLQRQGLATPRAADAHTAHCANFLVSVCHQASETAGWWHHQKTGLNLKAVINRPQDALQELLAGALVSQKLCLTHSEVSEAMEGHRKGLADDKLPHRSMLEVELADAVIRIADLAGAMGLDLGGAIAEKLAFNAQREDHKPEARAAAGGKAY